MKKTLFVFLVAGCCALASAQEQPQPAPPANAAVPHARMDRMRRMNRPEMLAELKLTDQEKAQLRDIRYETSKKEIELRSKLALSKLELGRLVAADDPDKEAISKRLSEISEQKTALELNKLNGWFEANKVLTPEQQKIWRKVLRRTVLERMGQEGHAERPPMRME